MAHGAHLKPPNKRSEIGLMKNGQTASADEVEEKRRNPLPGKRLSAQATSIPPTPHRLREVQVQPWKMGSLGSAAVLSFRDSLTFPPWSPGWDASNLS